MTTLYLLTLLDSLCGLFIASITLSAVALITALIVELSSLDDYDSGTMKRKCRKIVRYALPFFIVGIIGAVFVPNTKQAMIIYGVGTTLDYLKDNPTAKQLPDKTIMALDRWLSTEKPDSTK